MKLTWIIIAFVSGAVLPLQAGLNTRLGRAAASPAYASLISFVVGTLAMLLYIAITRQSVSWQGLREAPLHSWLGGILGAFFVTAIILAFPRIGPALTFGLVVAGQMTIALMLDHFNVMVANPHPINIWRVLGVLMIVGGVVLIRKF